MKRPRTSRAERQRINRDAMIFAVAVGALILGGLLGVVVGRRSGHRAVPVIATEATEPELRAGSDPRIDIERALADLRLGVVVTAAGGTDVYRNNRAKQYATGRHGDALVEAALQRVIDGALVGLSLAEDVEVYGPPAQSLLVQASPTYTDGVVTGAVGVIDDVTETRRIDRMRSDFVANVSHELRTPVGAMSVLAETIAEAEDGPTVARLADRMQREANRLANTIDDLLALSRLEAGPVSDPETIDLVSIATMAIERTGEAAEQRGVSVRQENTAAGPVLMEGDQGQLVSAVANLIDNAIKYSDSGGVVTVEVAIAGSTGAGAEAGDGGAAQLSVIDVGIGIPESDRDRIFERFYRVDSARSRQTGGTGLGLSIVRHALLNHRGTIDVSSTEGQGSIFTLRIPLARTGGPGSGPAGMGAARWNS